MSTKIEPNIFIQTDFGSSIHTPFRRGGTGDKHQPLRTPFSATHSSPPSAILNNL
jgi:hypothetical protein